MGEPTLTQNVGGSDSQRLARLPGGGTGTGRNSPFGDHVRVSGGTNSADPNLEELDEIALVQRMSDE